MRHGIESRGGDVERLPAEADTLCLGPGHAQLHALADAFALEFRDGPEDVQLQTPRRRRGVDALVQAHEGHTECGEFIEQQDEVTQVSAESV